MVRVTSIFFLYLNRSTSIKKSRSIRGNNDTINRYYIITEIAKEMCSPMALYLPIIEHLKTFAMLIRRSNTLLYYVIVIVTF